MVACPEYKAEILRDNSCGGKRYCRIICDVYVAYSLSIKFHCITEGLSCRAADSISSRVLDILGELRIWCPKTVMMRACHAVAPVLLYVKIKLINKSQNLYTQHSASECSFSHRRNTRICCHVNF